MDAITFFLFFLLAISLETVVYVILVLLVVGVLVWAADRYLPIAQPFKGIIMFLIILLACIWILHILGVMI